MKIVSVVLATLLIATAAYTSPTKIVLQDEIITADLQRTVSVESVTVDEVSVTVVISTQLSGEGLMSSRKRSRIRLTGTNYESFMTAAEIDLNKIKTFVEAIPEVEIQMGGSIRLPRL